MNRNAHEAHRQLKMIKHDKFAHVAFAIFKRFAISKVCVNSLRCFRLHASEFFSSRKEIT